MNKSWTLEYGRWNPDEHPVQETLCALGNGYLVCRGALEMERENDWNYPGTYLAGGYNRMESEIAGREVENEDLVNWPNWLWLTFKIAGGKWFSLHDVEILDYVSSLHMKQGLLERKLRFRDSQGRITTLISRRLVSMDDYHVAGIEWTFIPENWSGKMTIRSGLDGQVNNNNVARYADLNQDHLKVTAKGKLDDHAIFLECRTSQSDIRMVQGARTTFVVNEQELQVKGQAARLKNAIALDFTLECSKLVPIRLEKFVQIFTSRDVAISDPRTEAVQGLTRQLPFAELVARQQLSWERIWNYNDVIVNNSGEDQMVMRLHIFHLYQTVSSNSMDYDIGIPARGWHGEAYRGHIFWDELYIQPFIDLHYPQLSRSLLLYRYRRLPKAFELAEEIGCRGALFPWQSGSNGREETQKLHLNPKSGRWLPDVSHLQYHINVAVAFNVWHYYQSTADADFLSAYGAEIFLATALFWTDLCIYNPKRNRYEIHGVMGPDEYHTHYPNMDEPGLNNNAYTNLMVVWVVGKALRILDILDENCCLELEQKIGLRKQDKEKWEQMTYKMFIPFHNGNIISQFEGYEDLKELDWKHYRQKYGEAIRLDRILESENDSPNHYKASKQADVLMLFYLFSCEELQELFDKLGYDFNPSMIPVNIDYYYKRTSHGSTLSQVIHAWVYSRSHRDRSYESFKTALMSDFRDTQGGTTHEGIHLGAMAGTVDIIQRCYSGLEIRDDVLWLNPGLPGDIRSASFHVRYRGHWIKLDIDHTTIRITFCRGRAEPVYIGVGGKKYLFKTDDKKEFLINRKNA